MNIIVYVLLSKVGIPVGGFLPLIVAILVIYWTYRKDNPSSTYMRTGVDANQERRNALQTKAVKDEIARSRATASASGAYVIPEDKKDALWDYSGQNLTGANFAGKDLSFVKFDNAILTKANFSYANLDHASFKGANLEGADLYSANLKETDFRGANLYGCNYCGCEITGMILGDLPKIEPDEDYPTVIKDIQGNVIATLGKEYASEDDDISYAYFDEQNLCFADFENADLSNAHFGFCNLAGANFRNADLSNATIECCTVTDADFSGADLRNAQIDTSSDLEWNGAVYDDNTIFPIHRRSGCI